MDYRILESDKVDTGHESILIVDYFTVPERRMSEGMRLYYRHSLRLAGFDYSQAGGYFFTLVTQDRKPLFGDLVDGEIRLSAVGKMVERTWLEMEERFPNVRLDEYVIMPNHFHAIVFLDALPASPEDNRAGTSPAPTEEIPFATQIDHPSPVGAALVAAHPTGPEENWAGTSPAPTEENPSASPNHPSSVGAALVAAHTTGSEENRAGTSPAPTEETPSTSPTDHPFPVGAALVAAHPANRCEEWAGTSPAPTEEKYHTGEGEGRVTPEIRPSQNPFTGNPPIDPRTSPVRLGDVIGAFKSITTHNTLQLARGGETLSFSGRIWQRNYYEHVLRDDKELDAVRYYIDANPTAWKDDPVWRP